MAEQSLGNPDAAGNEGCLCRNVTGILASLEKRSCETSAGQEGILLTLEGYCVPHTYGSNYCLPHDLYDPACQNLTVNSPAYCLRPWCYVDSSSCISSGERLHRSGFFTPDDGVDVFYSFTTCDSSPDDWLKIWEKETLGSITLLATSPSDYFPPYMFKRSPSGDILAVAGKEYYNNSVPFEGVFVNYLNALQDIADGDFLINYTFGSVASRTIHPGNSYTAAVQDIEDGLVDMAVSCFWATGERLQMASFTKPLLHSPVVLVIPEPKRDDSLSAQTLKVLEPFTAGAWLLILAMIIFAACLSVCFSNRTKLAKKKGVVLRDKKSNHGEKLVYARLALDAFLENGIFFCSAGVSQDEGASLSHKILMFGFGFFILVVVSAYVANLAAFLTKSGVNEYVGTMHEVNARGLKVCAQPEIRTELEVAYSSTTFVYSQNGTINEMLDDYEANKCDFLACGYTHVTSNMETMNLFCEKNLVVTDSVVIDNICSFPIRHNLAAGLSHWIHEGEKNHGITVEALKNEYDDRYGRKPSCNVKLSARGENTASDDYAYITPKNLFFPITFFLACAILAMIVEIYRQRKSKQGKRALLFGRPSRLAERCASQLTLDTKDTISSESKKIDLDEFDGCLNDEDNDKALLLDQILVCVQELKRQKDH